MTHKEINFETALNQLEEIVRQLENGQVPLEKALELFTEGIRLTKLCNSQLDMAEKKIRLLLSDIEGKPVLKETDDLFCGGRE